MWTIKYKDGTKIKATDLSYDGTYFDYKTELCFGSIQKDLVESIKNNVGTIYKDEKPMKKVIRLDQPKEESKKPVQFTHYFNSRKWEKESFTGEEYDKIVYLGYDSLEGDMFACYINKSIIICKGHLNDGVY